MMSEYAGDDLLKLFKELNVSLRSLNPNVLKAWYDTDDEDLKRLLDWMCASLSKENYVSPLEYEEFLALENPLHGSRYDEEMQFIEQQYPGIFDAEANELEIELLEDEIEVALEEEKQLNELIKINENIDINLSRELSIMNTEELKARLELKSLEENGLALASRLDETNHKLYNQLVKYAANLHEFEYSATPKFINNMNIKKFQEDFDRINSILSPLLDVELPTMTGSEFDLGNTNCTMDPKLANNSSSDVLNVIKNRLFHSHQNYVVTKIEVEKAKEVLNYLNNTDIDTILNLYENAFTQMARKSKEETKRRLYSTMDTVSMKLAENQIAQTKLKYAEQELQSYQSKLDNVTRIENTICKFLSYCSVLSCLYHQEKENIDNTNQFFRKILHYINKDLGECVLRTGKMDKIIREYEAYIAEGVGSQFEVVKTILRILKDRESFDLSEAFKAVCKFRSELDFLENKAFHLDVYKHRETVKELENNVDILRTFLTRGPTRRIIVLPFELNQIFRQIDDLMKRQTESIKSTVEMCHTSKKKLSKWQNYRRQLWMYFYSDPKKMFLILQEVEDEFMRRKEKQIKK